MSTNSVTTPSYTFIGNDEQNLIALGKEQDQRNIYAYQASEVYFKKHFNLMAQQQINQLFTARSPRYWDLPLLDSYLQAQKIDLKKFSKLLWYQEYTLYLLGQKGLGSEWHSPFEYHFKHHEKHLTVNAYLISHEYLGSSLKSTELENDHIVDVVNHSYEVEQEGLPRPVRLMNHEEYHDLFSINWNTDSQNYLHLYRGTPYNPLIVENSHLKIFIGHHLGSFFNPQGSPLITLINTLLKRAKKVEDIQKILKIMPSMAPWSLYIFNKKQQGQYRKIVQYDLKGETFNFKHVDLKNNESYHFVERETVDDKLTTLQPMRLYYRQKFRSEHLPTQMLPINQSNDHFDVKKAKSSNKTLSLLQWSLDHDVKELAHHYFQMALADESLKKFHPTLNLLFHIYQLTVLTKKKDWEYLFNEIQRHNKSVNSFIHDFTNFILVYMSIGLKIPSSTINQEFRKKVPLLNNLYKEIFKYEGKINPMWIPEYMKLRKNIVIDLKRMTLWLKN